MKSGNLNFLEPSGPLQACNGTALLYDYVHIQEQSYEHLGNNTCLLTKWPPDDNVDDDDDVLIKMRCEICEKYFKLVHVL